MKRTAARVLGSSALLSARGAGPPLRGSPFLAFFFFMLRSSRSTTPMRFSRPGSDVRRGQLPDLTDGSFHRRSEGLHGEIPARDSTPAGSVRLDLRPRGWLLSPSSQSSDRRPSHRPLAQARRALASLFVDHPRLPPDTSSGAHLHE